MAELTGAVSPKAILKLSAHDVLPFENLSPHPEIQEERASVLWKIATGAASIVLVPLEAASMRLNSAEFYADLARIVRRGETIDIDPLLEHLRTIGYNSADAVDMPGEFALRGGILDVYPPEADRPLRIEFFGDEVETIRKFDPATQRSAAPVDEVILLPLTETPVHERVLFSTAPLRPVTERLSDCRRTLRSVGEARRMVEQSQRPPRPQRRWIAGAAGRNLLSSGAMARTAVKHAGHGDRAARNRRFGG